MQLVMYRIRRERHWPEELPADPRDPDVVRVKALARARLASIPHPNGERRTQGSAP